MVTSRPERDKKQFVAVLLMGSRTACSSTHSRTNRIDRWPNAVLTLGLNAVRSSTQPSLNLREGKRGCLVGDLDSLGGCLAPEGGEGSDADQRQQAGAGHTL